MEKSRLTEEEIASGPGGHIRRSWKVHFTGGGKPKLLDQGNQLRACATKLGGGVKKKKVIKRSKAYHSRGRLKRRGDLIMIPFLKKKGTNAKYSTKRVKDLKGHSLCRRKGGGGDQREKKQEHLRKGDAGVEKGCEGGLGSARKKKRMVISDRRYLDYPPTPIR